MPTVPPPPPKPAKSPLGHYLLHPGQETAAFFHHVLHALKIFGRAAFPAVVALGALALFGTLVLLFSQRGASTAGGHLVALAPGPEVDPTGGEVFWNALHGVLRRGRWGTFISGRGATRDVPAGLRRPELAAGPGSRASRSCGAGSGCERVPVSRRAAA